MRFVPVEEFQGLMLASDVSRNGSIAAIIGRNGAGKTRLLQAIAENKIRVVQDDVAKPLSPILHQTMDKLQPGLVFGFEPFQHQVDAKRAGAKYTESQGKFHIEPQKSVEAIGRPGMATDHERVTIYHVAHVASVAAAVLRKNINELDEQDIADHFTSAPITSLGSLNVTAIMLAYWHRLEQNDDNAIRNERRGTSRPYWTHEQFEARFGPPPWAVFNDFLRSVLDGRYQIRTPTFETSATYEAKLYRDDGIEIDPSWLSSGEKVLMWLCLSMYTANTGRMANPPRLLLLDEPDAALHPQMIQKLHAALKTIVSRFDCVIIFTTHSPTTVALFEDGPIFQVSENGLTLLEKDAAVGELLVGVDQVSIHYTNRRQVYVESHIDAELYGALFSSLRKWNIAISQYVSLAFIPAAPKLSPGTVEQLLKAHVGELDVERTEAFIGALNGQGNCAQVIGAVERLAGEGSATVHGVIDWDLNNKPQKQLHVLGVGLFYSIENAILNPLTLGLYLFHNYHNKIVAAEYGVADGFDPPSLYSDASCWQAIADGVTKRVLKVEAVVHDVQCTFLTGDSVGFDSRYVHMNGHDLESRLKGDAAYPFLNAIRKRPPLMLDVVQRGIQSCRGRSMPRAFADLFSTIQSSR